MPLNGYHFTIIEDQAVPLAGAPPTDNYAGYALAVVIIAAILLVGLIYSLWFRDHKKRIARLEINLSQYEEVKTEEGTFNLIHPRKLIEAEKLLEQKLAGYYATEVTDI